MKLHSYMDHSHIHLFVHHMWCLSNQLETDKNYIILIGRFCVNNHVYNIPSRLVEIMTKNGNAVNPRPVHHFQKSLYSQISIHLVCILEI